MGLKIAGDLRLDINQNPLYANRFVRTLKGVSLLGSLGRFLNRIIMSLCYYLKDIGRK